MSNATGDQVAEAHDRYRKAAAYDRIAAYVGSRLEVQGGDFVEFACQQIEETQRAIDGQPLGSDDDTLRAWFAIADRLGIDYPDDQIEDDDEEGDDDGDAR